jgi:hypothetical protein
MTLILGAQRRLSVPGRRTRSTDQGDQYQLSIRTVLTYQPPAVWDTEIW